MPGRWEAMKDVGACDKPRGGGNQPLIRGCLNGETRLGEARSLCPEYIGAWSERGEVKHLSIRRNGKQRDSVSSGERKRTRANQGPPGPWGCGTLVAGCIEAERLGTADQRG